jgi:hypothetical protein
MHGSRSKIPSKKYRQAALRGGGGGFNSGVKGLIYHVRNTVLYVKGPVFDKWHLKTTARNLEHQQRIAFVSALDSPWREVAGLRKCAKCVQVVFITMGNRYNVVGVETGLMVRMSGVRIQAGPKGQNGSGTQTASRLMSTTVLSCGISQRYDTGHKIASSCEVRNEWV